MKSADIDEKAIRKEKPEELVVALAQAKGRRHLGINLCFTNHHILTVKLLHVILVPFCKMLVLPFVNCLCYMYNVIKK